MFFADPLARIIFLSEYLSYGYNALLKQFWFFHLPMFLLNNLFRSSKLWVQDVQKLSFSSKKHSWTIFRPYNIFLKYIEKD